MQSKGVSPVEAVRWIVFQHSMMARIKARSHMTIGMTTGMHTGLQTRLRNTVYVFGHAHLHVYDIIMF